MVTRILLGGVAFAVVAFALSFVATRSVTAGHSTQLTSLAVSTDLEHDSSNNAFLTVRSAADGRFDVVDPEADDVAFDLDIICSEATCYRIEWVWGGHNRGWMKIRVGFKCWVCHEVFHEHRAMPSRLSLG